MGNSPCPFALQPYTNVIVFQENTAFKFDYSLEVENKLIQSNFVLMKYSGVVRYKEYAFTSLQG